MLAISWEAMEVDLLEFDQPSLDTDNHTTLTSWRKGGGDVAADLQFAKVHKHYLNNVDQDLRETQRYEATMHGSLAQNRKDGLQQNLNNTFHHKYYSILLQHM